MSGFRTSHSVKVNSVGEQQNDIVKIGGTALALGQAVAGSSIPVVLPAGTDLPCDMAKVGGTALSFGQAAMAVSIPVVLANNQTALSVSMTNAATAGTRGNLENNQAVASADTSTEVDVSTARNCVIFGEGASLTDNITVEVSEDGTNWNKIDAEIYPIGAAFYSKHTGIAWKEVRLKWGGTATGVWATVLYN